MTIVTDFCPLTLPMKITSRPPDRLTPLSDGTLGVRSSLTVSVSESAVGKDGVLSVPDQNPCLDFVASDESLDRYHEIVSVSGWDLSNYQRNPVFQNAH